jgi:UDP-N-acetylmuramyl tripeptide synthase
MEYLDARRLTGPNLLWDEAGSILDVGCTPEEAERLVPLWERNVRQMLDAVGWGAEATCFRPLTGGVSCAFSAPIDALYSAAAINEWAWECCKCEMSGEAPPDFEQKLAQIAAQIAEEVNPPLLSLAAAATQHGVSFLWDDDEVSVGLGSGSETWPFRQLPNPEELDWDRYHDVPAGVITGTNGKTTTARLSAHILRCADKNVGMSSTDWYGVNDRIIDRGDWSGPGGARHVLREKDVEVAILETARGGLLRRGMGVEKADAALITNISEDHLGDFGSQTLPELLDVKWVVSHVVRKHGTLVLNADDPLLVDKAADYSGTLVWFSLDADNPVVAAHTAAGGIAFVLRDDKLERLQGRRRATICAAADIPITMHGAARHNVANSLAAAALTDRMGISLDSIVKGLTSMTQDSNPGRSNVFKVKGFNVLIDFAHNPRAFEALFDMARALPAKRRVLCFGQAGDRTDELIRDLARSAWNIGLDAVIVSELAHYWRGRERGDVFAIIKDELLQCGAREDQIHHFEEELESLDAALDWAQDGDLVIMLALGGSKPVEERLSEYAAQ